VSSLFAYICLGSNNLERSAGFYDATMAVLGYRRCVTDGESGTSWADWIGWGLYEQEGAVQDALWICKPYDGAPATVSNGGMVALWAKDWASVDEFHAKALAHGGVSEGAPGLRLAYNPDFYACYVRDPDGNKLAVVCRGFTSPQLHRNDDDAAPRGG
jgi:catechol 2,3-dioxygenase-like lactoylglutathione lyase family enzyme